MSWILICLCLALFSRPIDKTMRSLWNNYKIIPQTQWHLQVVRCAKAVPTKPTLNVKCQNINYVKHLCRSLLQELWRCLFAVQHCIQPPATSCWDFKFSNNVFWRIILSLLIYILPLDGNVGWRSFCFSFHEVEIMIMMISPDASLALSRVIPGKCLDSIGN